MVERIFRQRTLGQKCDRRTTIMNITIINILCEGQTEEKFAKEILKPFLKGYGLIIKTRLLMTSKKLGASGGMLSFTQAKHDLLRWINENAYQKSERHIYTTMFDFYALPTDFPGYSEINKFNSPYDKVKKIEDCLSESISYKDFIPYIQLHEFEALLFCGIKELAGLYPNNEKTILQLNSVLAQYDGNPELIDNSPQTAPSKRIINAVETNKKHKYNKPQTAVEVIQKIGLEKVYSEGQHFKEWIDKILGLIL